MLAADWASTERISWFPIPDEEELGAPSNVVRTHAWWPELMLRWLDFYDIITASVYNYNNRVAEAAGHLPDRANHGAFR